MSDISGTAGAVMMVQLVTPKLSLWAHMPAKLNGAMPLTEVDQLVRAGRLDSVLEENARIVLRDHMGLSAADCTLLKSVWTKMRDRRNSRRRGARKAAQGDAA